MTHVLQQVYLISSKDLRIEARSRQTLGLVVVLGVLIVVVLGLGLGPEQVKSGIAATAVLWVAYLFGGVLCFEKTMVVERHDGALAGLMLAPVDRGAIYAGKLLSNLILMVALSLVVTPVAVIMFGFDLSTSPIGFVAIMAGGFVGFAAVGTLFSAAVSSTRLQGGLLAIVIFPVSLPLVIVSTQMMMRLFGDNEPFNTTGVLVLIAFDAIYLTVSWLVFELILEP